MRVCVFSQLVRTHSQSSSAFLDEVTAALLHEISRIVLAPSLPRDLVKRSLAELLIRYQEDRFDSPHSRQELYRTISGASHLLGDMLPHALDIVRRGSKGFATEVRGFQLHNGIFQMNANLHTAQNRPRAGRRLYCDYRARRSFCVSVKVRQNSRESHRRCTRTS